jgi:7,8-dihydropterin-6-yl-methyl-4-(beta-D-ribofuranosyl)aminobenzene 5'-phosphate synthase
MNLILPVHGVRMGAMGIRITTLSENTAGQPDILAEWGLSLLIETDGGSILLDAGASTSVVQNADRLGIDLKKIGKIVLSHGHFDHTGGLRVLLSKIQREVEVIAHPDIWEPKYNRREGKPDRYIGIPYQPRELEGLGARFILTPGPVKLSENIMTTGEVPQATDFEQIDSSLYVKTADGWEADKVLDDLAVLIKTESGLVVVLGCAHRGMINTLYHAREVTGVKKIHMVLGGSHLKDATDEQIWQAISALNEMGVEKLGVSHCTGMRATLLLAQTYGDDFIFNNTGNIINLP